MNAFNSLLRLLLALFILVAVVVSDYDMPMPEQEADLFNPYLKKGSGPSGPLRFGKRRGPSGPLRFGKRSSYYLEDLLR